MELQQALIYGPLVMSALNEFELVINEGPGSPLAGRSRRWFSKPDQPLDHNIRNAFVSKATIKVVGSQLAAQSGREQQPKVMLGEEKKSD